jgi:hypothetical protein
MSLLKRGILTCLLTATTWVGQASAAAFTAGDLLVVRVGDGSTALSTNAAAVSLLEYTRSGTLVQTITVTSSGTSALTMVGTTTTEGLLTASNNGQYFLLAGYGKNAGGSNPSADASTTTSRVIGQVALGGTVNTTTALTDAYSAVSIRGASSDNGTRFWTSGATASSGGLRYVSSLGATSSTLLGSSSNDLLQVSVQGGNLFTSSGAATPGRSVFQVGSGLPTSGSPTFTSSFSPGSTQKFQSFYFTNLGSGNNWNGTGFDTLYAVDSSGATLGKYSFNGTSWALNNTKSLAGILNVAGSTQGTTVTLFVTTASKLESFTDTAGYNVNLSGSFTSLATAGSNYAFRGVAAIPEPGPFLLTALSGLAMAVYGLRRQG